MQPKVWHRLLLYALVIAVTLDDVKSVAGVLLKTDELIVTVVGKPQGAGVLGGRFAVRALTGGGVTLANIDFSSQRVDRDKISIEAVQRGTMEIKVSANGQLLPKDIEQIASQVTGRVASVCQKSSCC